MTVNRVHIKNFKSIVDLAPINVFIGENGSGKSNILEALAFAAAAAGNKLDNEFLVSRGIRVTDPRFMRSAFADPSEGAVSIAVQDGRGHRVTYEINTSGDSSYPKWRSKLNVDQAPDIPLIPSEDELARLVADPSFSDIVSRLTPSGLEDLIGKFKIDVTPNAEDFKDRLSAALALLWIAGYKRGQDILLDDFIVYSPEISALRTFEKEGQILPLGVRGEGLLKLLRVLASEDKAAWHALQDNLSLLDWLLGIDIDHDNSLPEQSVRIRDRFLATTQPAFDQRSANEGFLYLLFSLRSS